MARRKVLRRLQEATFATGGVALASGSLAFIGGKLPSTLGSPVVEAAGISSGFVAPIGAVGFGGAALESLAGLPTKLK